MDDAHVARHLDLIPLKDLWVSFPRRRRGRRNLCGSVAALATNACGGEHTVGKQVTPVRQQSRTGCRCLGWRSWGSALLGWTRVGDEPLSPTMLQQPLLYPGAHTPTKRQRTSITPDANECFR